MESGIIKSFGKSIYESTKDVIIDYAEIGLDSLTEQVVSGIAKEIPFVKSVYCIKNAFLTIEKLLKAIYAKLNEESPYLHKIHNLNILAEKCNIELDERKTKILMTCNSFNISVRYEDYKNEFYERCTEEYTSEQIKNIEEVRTWLKKMFFKKCRRIY